MSKDLDNSLISNLHQQLNRLVQQLADVEAEKDSLNAIEYQELRQETIEQLEELNISLNKLQEGNISLVDEISATRFAIQGAISAAFKTPEIVSLFVKRQPVALRERLIALDTEHRLGKIQENEYKSRKREALLALQKLHDHLSSQELQFLTDTDEKVDFDFELTETSRNRTYQGNLLK